MEGHFATDSTIDSTADRTTLLRKPSKYGPPRADAIEFLNAMTMPDGDDIDFDPPKLDIVFRPAEF